MINVRSGKQYFPLIDIARFFSALSVVFFHYFSITASHARNGFIKAYLENGFFGVQFFFMISGFVIYFSTSDNLKKYFISRFLRIYPLFWFCMTVTYLITLVFAEKHVSFLIYLFNFLIVNNGRTEYMVDGSYWTLTHEILFYMYVGIFVYFFGKRRINLFFYGWLAVLSLVIFLGLHNMILFKIMLVRSGFYFIFGGLLASLIHNWKQLSFSEKLKPILGMTWSVTMVFVLSNILQKSSAVVTNHFGVYNQTQVFILVSLFITMIFIATLSSFVKGEKNIKVAMVLGSITYPLYLLHQVIGATFLEKLGVYGRVSFSSVTFICVLVILSFSLARKEKKIRSFLQSKMVSLIK